MKDERYKIRWYVPVGHYTATHHVNQSQQAEKVNASFLKSLTDYLAVGLITRSIIREKLTVFRNVYKTENLKQSQSMSQIIRMPQTLIAKEEFH